MCAYLKLKKKNTHVLCFVYKPYETLVGRTKKKSQKISCIYITCIDSALCFYIWSVRCCSLLVRLVGLVCIECTIHSYAVHMHAMCETVHYYVCERLFGLVWIISHNYTKMPLASYIPPRDMCIRCGTPTIQR